MKSKRLLDAIGNIYDCFINEDADDVDETKYINNIRSARISPKLKVAIPAVACVCVIAVGTYAILSRRAIART